jgi:succinate dehydrogenase / fumarate reductase flavoprotein subunit
MQGLADGYFIVPYTLGNHIASNKLANVDTNHPAFNDAERAAKERIDKIFSVRGKRTVDDIHRDLGRIMWDKCGMARNAGNLKQAIEEIRGLRDEFWSSVKVLGSGEAFNQNLEHAGRVADFLEFGELLVNDALHREESCGGHFREEHQTEENEARRDDENFKYVAAWEYNGVGNEPTLHKEPLEFENVPLATRSYK